MKSIKRFSNVVTILITKDKLYKLQMASTIFISWLLRRLLISYGYNGFEFQTVWSAQPLAFFHRCISHAFCSWLRSWDGLQECLFNRTLISFMLSSLISYNVNLNCLLSNGPIFIPVFCRSLLFPGPSDIPKSIYSSLMTPTTELGGLFVSECTK